MIKISVISKLEAPTLIAYGPEDFQIYYKLDGVAMGENLFEARYLLSTRVGQMKVPKHLYYRSTTREVELVPLSKNFSKGWIVDEPPPVPVPESDEFSDSPEPHIRLDDDNCP
jgi:hypothetical protein